VLNKPKNIKRV